MTVMHDVDAFNVLRRGPGPKPAPEGTIGLEVIPLTSGIGPVSPFLTQQTGRPLVNGRKIRTILERGRFDVVNFNNISLIGGPKLLAYGGNAVRVYLAHEHWLVCPTTSSGGTIARSASDASASVARSGTDVRHSCGDSPGISNGSCTTSTDSSQ